MNRFRPADVLSVATLLFMLSVAGPQPASAAQASQGVAGYSVDEALRLGEDMYLKGMLPSGKPMEAVVQGDLPISGSMMTCAHCHMRSGLGSLEGNVLTHPTNGAKLYAPRTSAQDLPGSGMQRQMIKFQRPAYTDELLARAMRSGVDPAGRVMIESMPRYQLDDRDMEVLVFYLKNLSSKLSSGVTGSVIRFATIIAGEVSERDRSAMIDPLKAYLNEEWNIVMPMLSQAQRDTSYRRTALDVWELKGAPDTWNDQLEALYRRQPVFAVLGGLASGPWAPIHRFCEKNGIPAIFPLTPLPEVSERDRSTLYFSKGYYQEGMTVAGYLSRVIDLPADKQIVQVSRGADEGRALSQGFMDGWNKLGRSPVKDRAIPRGEALTAAFWKDLYAGNPNAVLLLWLGQDDIAGMNVPEPPAAGPAMVFVSSTLLGGKLSVLPDQMREYTLASYPARLPEEQGQVVSIVDMWLTAKKIPQTNPVISAKVYFLTRMLAQVLTNMRGDCYRDFFLDLFDVLEDQTATVAAFPRLSFGPGQRYASKGCYIVAVTKGPEPKIIKRSDWIVY